MMTQVELVAMTEAAVMRGTDPNCQLRTEARRAANRLAYDEIVEDTLLRGAGKVYMVDYDPTTIKAPAKVYYAPHAIGKPEDFTVEFQSSDELFQGWYNENPIETE